MLSSPPLSPSSSTPLNASESQSSSTTNNNNSTASNTTTSNMEEGDYSTVKQTSRDPFQDDTNRSTLRFAGLGVGKPLETDDRRDFTVKASRRPAPPPPPPSHAPSPLTIPSSSASSSPELPRRPTHKHSSSSSSSSSSIHPQIVSPVYTIRSQPIGLTRSSSFHDQPNSPTISGGITRRLSVSSESGGSDVEEEEEVTGRGGWRRGRDINRPLKHRAESLPVFPPPEVVKMRSETREEAMQRELAQLSPNPRLWLPSHLSLYIADRLKLHPEITADITLFIRSSRLDGRTFLRLKDADFEELGINQKWRVLLSQSREQLRLECLGGRMWSYEGVRKGDDDDVVVEGVPGSISASEGESTATTIGTGSAIRKGVHGRRGSMDVEGSQDEEEQGKEDWKKSWKMLKGKERVKMRRGAFERNTSTTTATMTMTDRIEEGSREGTPENSPIKRNELRKSPWPGSGGKTVGGGLRSSWHEHGRDDSVDSITSEASVDSGSGGGPTNASASASGTDPFAASIDSPHDDEGGRKFEQLDASTYQSKISAQPRPYGLVRRPSGRSGGQPTPKVEKGEFEWETTTVGRRGNGSSEGREEKRGGIRELFEGVERQGVGVEKVEKEVEEGEEWENGGSEEKEGSMVLVKRSQLEALSKRMKEVEDRIALSQGSLSRPISPYLLANASEIDEIEYRMDSIESHLPFHRASSLTHANTNNASISSWVQSSLSALASPTSAHRPPPTARQNDDLLSWTALGGYVVAASFGIGLVAGEVVVSKVFGFRRR